MKGAVNDRRVFCRPNGNPDDIISVISNVDNPRFVIKLFTNRNSLTACSSSPNSPRITVSNQLSNDQSVDIVALLRNCGTNVFCCCFVFVFCLFGVLFLFACFLLCSMGRPVAMFVCLFLFVGATISWAKVFPDWRGCA